MQEWLRSFMICTIVLLSSLPLLAAAPADIIITRARIYTLNPAKPWAEAVAVRGGSIVAVGNQKSVLLTRGPKTRLIDAGGRLLLPGFTDAHIHFMEGSMSLTQVALDETKDLAEIQEVLREYAATHPAKGDGAWVVGRGWNYSQFGEAKFPNKKYLDEIFPDRPVFMEGFDGHTGWVNSKALEVAGITRSTPDPLNGKIVRDANGDATGTLQEDSMNLVVEKIPPPSHAERIAALRRGMVEANRLGVVRIINCGNDTPNASDDAFPDYYDELRKSGELTLRVVISNYADPSRSADELYAKAEALRKAYPATDAWLAAGAVKFFTDGVIEGHTAALLAPYSDDPSTSGSFRWDPAIYKKMVTELDRRGFQVFSHAVGDAGVRLALDAYAAAAKANHTSDMRHRIEHIETVAASDIPRFASTGTIASMQPLHAYPDADTLGVWLSHAGPDRGSRAWAWKSIAARGGHLAFGSDWPVVTMNPWYGIESAVTRQTREGDPPGGFVPNERLTVARAVEGYTLGGAFAGHHERTEGSIEAGKVADMILLSQDLFLIPPHDIHKTEVLLTMVGGKVVYTAPDFLTAPAKKDPTKGH